MAERSELGRLSFRSAFYLTPCAPDPLPRAIGIQLQFPGFAWPSIQTYLHVPMQLIVDITARQAST